MTRMSFERACAIVGALLLLHGSASAQQPATASQRTMQGFSIVLVLGDLQGGPTPDNIPAVARAALGDLRDFLPYKGYRLLDSSWILGSTTQLFRATTQLRGLEEQTYEVSLTSSPVGGPAPPSLQMRFVMQDHGETLIDTSFNMRIGETVVVGTSKVRGDKALIALLTAVRK